MQDKKSYILSTLIKGISVFIRFFFFYWLATVLSVSDYGTFSILTTIITIGIVVLGFDQYIYYNRELSSDMLSIRTIISNQIKTTMPFALISLLISVIGFCLFDYFPFTIIILLSVIIFTEWLLQEAIRIVIVCNKPFYANILMFTKTCIYPVVIVVVYFIGLNISIDKILLIWIFFNICHVIYIVIKYSKNISFSKLHTLKSEIKKSFMVSLPFFISTIGLRAIEFSNKFIIDGYLSREHVGVFSFFNSIYFNINSIIYSTIVVFSYPEMLSSINDMQKFKKAKINFIRIMTIFFIAISFAIIILYFILPYLNLNNKYVDYSYLLFIFLLASIIFNFSLVSHYSLYAKRKDFSIIVITIAIAIFSLLLNIMMVKHFSIFGAAISVLISNALLFVLKSIIDIYSHGTIKRLQ